MSGGSDGAKWITIPNGPTTPKNSSARHALRSSVKSPTGLGNTKTEAKSSLRLAAGNDAGDLGLETLQPFKKHSGVSQCIALLVLGAKKKCVANDTIWAQHRLLRRLSL